MTKINISVNQMEKFAGKWVAIDPKKELVIAVGDTLKEIAPFVTGKVGQENKIKAYSFKVPHKGEGPYVLPFL